ncbi:hypothetical protein SBRY_70212 [Actinacidiphila bryophytorum]|uniref:Uncharacterized protein n=1 Tax=Actinacidiphila bryophytorum TaxID=1436133 RepID=A0A9W4H7A1_9ACTN|nr:hypothetical protein SBRY_70212 [Actinacidiphila bryophytorum]
MAPPRRPAGTTEVTGSADMTGLTIGTELAGAGEFRTRFRFVHPSVYPSKICPGIHHQGR